MKIPRLRGHPNRREDGPGLFDGEATSTKGGFRSPESGVLLPLYVFVDTRTMTVRTTIANPNPAELATELERAVAELDGAPPPAPHREGLVDGIFHRNEWDLIRDVGGLRLPPPDPTNVVADSAAAAALGKSLFFDTNLSRTGAVSCATCHDPKKQLSDALPVAMGLAKGTRKTPRGPSMRRL